MRIFLSLVIICCAGVIFAQESDTHVKPEIKRPYKLSDFSLSYSGSVYNFSSIYLDHAHDLYNFTNPGWPETDSMLAHDNRSEIHASLSFSKQLIDEKSYFYGNLNAGISACIGGTIKAAYMYDYTSHTDSSFINSEQVTNLDTMIVKQNEYVYNSTDVGFNVSYTISSPPKYTFKAESGIGISGLFSVTEKLFFTDSQSINYKYIDRYNRQQSFNNEQSVTTELKPKSQFIIRAYIPLILTYKLSQSGKLALTTTFAGGIDFMKPSKASFYSYPYFAIGVGCRFHF